MPDVADSDSAGSRIQAALRWYRGLVQQRDGHDQARVASTASADPAPPCADPLAQFTSATLLLAGCNRPVKARLTSRQTS
jgi:hypothetical protein